ncbi:P-loop containing nucleoside triphosphate hydrolase protein [Mucidula mucida]|nr:P-loop containing nucleoside triphosphate hydrolase protein [Mucidula mucida]
MSVETLIPRRYQEEIFVKAQTSNVVAALDTGSGKTFISTLLIKWIAAQPGSYSKSVVFLAPKVALAQQQADFIARHTSFRVLKVYGAMEVDVSDREGWQRKFAQHDVIVTTPQVLYNLITHSVWKISKVSLLVFDECHHTRKNHPYNMIMREYCNVPASKRPKIFGMTASPILNPKQAEQSLKELEKNMDSVVIGVNDSTELQDHSPRPQEIVRIYSPSPLDPYCPVSTLWASLTVFPILASSELDFEWQVVERRYQVTLYNLGPFCAAMYLYKEMWSRIGTLIVHRSTCDEDIAESKALPDDIYHVAEVLLDYEPFFPTDVPIELNWCSPKVRELVEIIRQHHSPTFQGIVFVEQRQDAACLADILPNVPELKGLISCGDLVGKGSSVEGISNTRNGDAVLAFRQKRINLLIATNVAEEGLDFPACDLVIRFDKVQHLVGYVQSRGRARNKASTFIIMLVFLRTGFENALPDASRSPDLKETIEPIVDEEDDDDDVDDADLQARARYVVPSTGAFLTYDNAINLIGYLCALIPVDKYTSPQLPEYTDNHPSVLRLPACLPLPPEDLVFEGPFTHSKKEAKRAVAFMAVKGCTSSMSSMTIFFPWRTSGVRQTGILRGAG